MSGQSSFYVPKTQKGIFGNGLAWMVAVGVVILVVLGAVWGFKTAFAPRSGKAGAYRTKESAQNRVFAQQTFEQEDADYAGYLLKIKTYTGPLSATRQTELEGLRQLCITVAQTYNADSRKYLLRDFKSFDLPVTLDASAC